MVATVGDFRATGSCRQAPKNSS